MNAEHCCNCSSKICQAVKNDDTKLVRDCIKKNPTLDLDINYNNNTLCLPLLWHAAMNDSLDIAKVLIKAGADVNGKIVGACEALCRDTHKRVHHPTNEKHGLTIVEVLARCRARRKERRLSDHELFEYLIKHGATINSDYSVQKHSPLWHAMKNNNFEIAELLVKNGADLVGPEWDEEPAIIMASKCKKAPTFISLFIKHGADATKKGPKGTSAMHYLFSNKEEIYHSYSHTSKILVENGVGLDEPNFDGVSPFHLVVQNTFYVWFIRDLLEKEEVDLHRRDKNGLTPLHYACSRLRGFSSLNILLEYGADVDVEDKKGRTPISIINKRHGPRYLQNILIRHIALMNRNKDKLKNKKRKLNSEDLENEKNRLRIHEKNMKFIRSHRNLSKYYEDCEDELTKMEEIKLGDSFTYYDILNWPKNREELMAMLKKAGGEVLKKFKEVEWETMFPCYKDNFVWTFRKNNPSHLNMENILNN